MRVLMLAPFERGRGHGGSQRATAVAERLEDRGVEVGWQTIRSHDTTHVEKLGSLVRLQPALSGLYEPPGPWPAGSWDALIVAHSYLVPAVRRAGPTAPMVVDFHNLEWRHLADGEGGQGPGSGLAAPALRQAYVRGQVALMRRLERAIVNSSDLSLFVSEEERAWATAAAQAGSTLLVRSVIPRAEQDAAAAIAADRIPEPGHLVYVGTLTFPTNLASLERFLTSCWPAVRESAPSMKLTVAGACEATDRERINRHPGVRALGFVDDLTTLLRRCTAVVMPFEGSAGTSLRTLFYALAGLPVIGSEQAFRGFAPGLGTIAAQPSEWAKATAALAGRPNPSVSEPARQRAVGLQHDPEPWDRLADALLALTSKARAESHVTAAAPREVRA